MTDHAQKIKRVELLAPESIVYVDGKRFPHAVRMTIVQSAEGELICAFVCKESNE